MNREEKLKTDFNTFITSKFNLAEKDFYNELSTKDFFELKNLLSNINNIITLKLTIQFIAEIAGYYNFSSQTIESVVNSIQSINPNTNGFDIEISSPVKIVAEVKSNIPINNGFVFGSAQKNGILRDFSSLKNGKSKSNIDTKDYYKFFVLPDTENTRKATSNLLDLLKNNNEYINFVFETGDVVRFADGDIHGLKNNSQDVFEYISVTSPPINFGYAYKDKK